MSAASGIPTQTARWRISLDTEALERAAAAQVLDAAREAIAERGVFHVVLAGGTTPRRLYERLREADADWSRWQIWFGDERCLPPDDAERNSRMAQDAWLDHVPIPPGNAHVIDSKLGPAAAAAAYAHELEGIGEFDLVLLGLGEDGHTASLFPGRDWRAATGLPAALAVFNAPKPPPERVSLSPQRLSTARRVFFLVTGEGKRQAVREWRSGIAIPASAIAPDGGVDVFLDAAAMGGATDSTPC